MQSPFFNRFSISVKNSTYSVKLLAMLQRLKASCILLKIEV
jgi:hypothetical protein